MLNVMTNFQSDMGRNPFSCLLEALPLHSEEDDLREEIAESSLIKRLPEPDGHGLVLCIRRLFEACGLLDARLLNDDKWAFVSFPATLVGHSLLHTLAAPGQQFFPGNYWRSNVDDDIEQQRTLLSELENRREELHPTRSPCPVRFVYVAWGLIRLGDSFLLHRREDRLRPDVKNYGFPGGRFRPLDLPENKREPAILRQLQNPESSLAMSALERTLQRELMEELKLSSKDWRATPSVVLRPYRKVEGAKNAHALTEYLITLYDISLTPEGEARLLDRIDANSEKLVWFSIDDLLDPTGRSDGKSAFIDALSTHFGEKQQINSFFKGVPSSSTTEYRFNTPNAAVELPTSPGRPVLVGQTGKERTRLIEFSVEEHALLILLAGWGKGLRLTADAYHIDLLPGGWLRVNSEKAKSVLLGLEARLVSADMPLLQSVRAHFVRFAVDPVYLFFAEEMFQYGLSKDGSQRGEVTVAFHLPPSLWAKDQSLMLRISVPGKMLRSLQAIESGSVGPAGLEPFGYTDDTMKKNCKEMLDTQTRLLGLRKLVRLSSKNYRICAVRMQC
jgi:hypothetical protein